MPNEKQEPLTPEELAKARAKAKAEVGEVIARAERVHRETWEATRHQTTQRNDRRYR